MSTRFTKTEVKITYHEGERQPHRVYMDDVEIGRYTTKHAAQTVAKRFTDQANNQVAKPDFVLA